MNHRQKLVELRDELARDNERWLWLMDLPDSDNRTRDEAVGKSDLADYLIPRIDAILADWPEDAEVKQPDPEAKMKGRCPHGYPQIVRCRRCGE